MSKPKNSGLRARVVGGEVVISIGVDTLAHAFNESEYAKPFDDEKGDWISKLEVADPLEFARGVVEELLKEDEEGTTAVHLLLDKACESAADNGSLGVEEL
jgi:hypothetical protein